MAVGLAPPGELLAVRGVHLAAGHAGVKKNGSSDLLIIALDAGAAVAGVFTRNAYCAAPVTLSIEHLASAPARALIINSGNANAGTGKAGYQDAVTLCEACAESLGIDANQVLPFSTGVIGARLPVEPMKQAIATLADTLSNNGWLAAAQAIMTTDTVPKAVSKQLDIDGQTITITGISKGSGMIHPDMATMLSFVATDAAVDNAALAQLTQRVADNTFNCITVDGDTSTNDSFITMATGAAANSVLNENHAQWAAFTQALEDVCLELAHAIVRDGEGATRFVGIRVGEGLTSSECRQVALTVAHSPLVKTALFAGDPNLGRILAAIGRSGLEGLDISGVSLSLNDLPVVINGEPAAGYDESRAVEIMAKEEFELAIGLGRGAESAVVWTTDLSYDYVKINAEYRT